MPQGHEGKFWPTDLDMQQRVTRYFVPSRSLIRTEGVDIPRGPVDVSQIFITETIEARDARLEESFVCFRAVSYAKQVLMGNRRSVS